ncbi:hypothetical protein M5D96_003965 [Drosophila gunungcola]|uniref:Uncharacterized protein n=1 Tax=Drosophila gunungcola TaxID=103775 RepID=A0A9Q0BSX9_9MUSC|nr:hypothetical protein M5D96_003965 [Drosophila gunungcola]
MKLCAMQTNRKSPDADQTRNFDAQLRFESVSKVFYGTNASRGFSTSTKCVHLLVRHRINKHKTQQQIKNNTLKHIKVAKQNSIMNH